MWWWIIVVHLSLYNYTHQSVMPCYGGHVAVSNKGLHELMWENLLKYGNDIAMIDESRNGMSLTYMDLYRNSRKVAAYLQSIGIKKSDFVAICAFGSLEFTYLMIGILGSGGIISPCNPSYRKPEVLHEFNISCPRVVFVEEEMVERMKSVKEDVSFIEKLIVIGKSNEFTTLADIVNDPDIGPPRKVEIDQRNDVAIAPRSSGTTGLPKCLLLSHRSLVSNYATSYSDSDIYRKRDTRNSLYTDRPMFHGSGFHMALRCVLDGLRLVTTRNYQLDEMFRIIEKYQATTTICAPSVLVEMANATNSDKYDLSSLKLILCTGAALSPDVAQRIMQQYQLSIVTLYAISEGGAVASHHIQPGDTSNSCGKLIDNVIVKVTDIGTEEECPAGCDGEIRVRSPQIMKEYFKNDAANATAFDKDGWFKTGDIGHVDEDGNIYITDRLKEIIQYRTTQVSPAQLESVIISHPKVADVGVIGIPDERDGELPKAFVVPSDKSLTVEDVHKIVNDNLVEYKHLRGGVQFVTAIPKSETGKIQRGGLKKMAGL